MRRRAIVGFDQLLRDDRHLMDRAIAEIDQLFGMAESERGTRSFGGLVAGIGRRRSVALAQGGRHGVEADGAGPPAITDGLEFAVPMSRGHPDFDSNLRIGGRAESGGDAAMGRDGLGGGTDIRGGYGCAGQSEGGEAVARDLCV